MDHLLASLGWIDLNLESSIFSPILPGLMYGNLAEAAGQVGKMVDGRNLSLPNPGSRAVGPPCMCLQAVKAWLPEFSRQKTVWGPMSKPQVGLTAPIVPPTVNACISNPTGASAMVTSQMSSASPLPPTASDFPHPESATAAGRTKTLNFLINL